MNTIETNRDDSDDERTSDENLCLLYLFGELESDAKTRFERRLEVNPQLCETLLQQSDLITAAAAATDNQVAQPTETPRSTTLLTSAAGRSIAALAAIAACIGLVIQLVHYSASSSDHLALHGGPLTSEAELDESVLIAKAWASSQDATNSVAHETSMIDDVEPLDDFFAEQPSDLDATLDWIFVAVASRDETPLEEGTDG